MGINKDVEKSIKKDGFIKRNTKKGVGYVKNESFKYSNMKEVLFYKNIIVDMVEKLNPFNKSEKKQKVETFDNAVERLNLTEKDLMESHKYYMFCFWLGFILTVSALFFGFYVMLFIGNIWAIGSTVACVAIGLSQAMSGSFRAFQINTRELCSVKKWYESRKFFPSAFKTDEYIKKEKRMLDKKSLEKLAK